jgi:hypothetical protein
MEELGVDQVEAEFIVSVEYGDLPGDVMAVTQEGQETTVSTATLDDTDTQVGLHVMRGARGQFVAHGNHGAGGGGGGGGGVA